MEVGYVVFNLKPGAKKDFLLQARKIKTVKDVRIVLGNWDAIAVIQAENVEEKAVSYTDQLRARIGEIDGQIVQLDEDFRSGKIAGDEYTDKRLKLKQTVGSLREELSRMGVVT